jgi:hypothetical protein
MIRVPSEYCHSYRSVCECLIREDNNLLYDYATSLRGCDINPNVADWLISKVLTTSVLRGNCGDDFGGMDITETIGMFSSRDLVQVLDNLKVDIDFDVCVEALEFSHSDSPHWSLHTSWGFDALGDCYEIFAVDYLEKYGNDSVVKLFHRCSTNCAVISKNMRIGDMKHVVYDIFELVTDITEDEDGGSKFRDSENFKKFLVLDERQRAI